jgi:LysM repeat protein
MTINADHSRNFDLVNRYAARIRSRHDSVAMPVRTRHRTQGIHTFGRRPVTHTRSGSTRSKRAFTTLMATAIMATAAPAASASSSSGYEVQTGDTLTSIAEQHGMSIDELLQINAIDDPNQIQVGAQLQLSSQQSGVKDRIQSENEADADSDIQIGDTVYEVREGDTLFEIAQEHGVSLGELLTANDINDENVVFAGDFLIIPTSSQDLETVLESQDIAMQETQEIPVVQEPEPVAEVDDDSYIVSLHFVARGETPGGIAQRYGITVDQLLMANGLNDVTQVPAGNLLRIPDPSWTGQAPSQPARVAPETVQDVTEQDQTGAQPERSITEVNEHPISSESMLDQMPVQQQALPLSSSTASLSMTTAYWGHQVSEWVFIENMSFHPNPHRGFRGDMEAAAGGIGDYGVYPKPLSTMLSNYGFIGDEFYTMGDPQELKERIDRGQPVLVWMTSNATPQNRFYEWHQGERFALVPQQMVAVAYGYDNDSIHIADPGTGQNLTYSWTEFINSWSTFDGMSMAVYPKG